MIFSLVLKEKHSIIVIVRNCFYVTLKGSMWIFAVAARIV